MPEIVDKETLFETIGNICESQPLRLGSDFVIEVGRPPKLNLVACDEIESDLVGEFIIVDVETNGLISFENKIKIDRASKNTYCVFHVG